MALKKRRKEKLAMFVKADYNLCPNLHQQHGAWTQKQGRLGAKGPKLIIAVTRFKLQRMYCLYLTCDEVRYPALIRYLLAEKICVFVWLPSTYMARIVTS